jgi:hypothetical protein
MLGTFLAALLRKLGRNRSRFTPIDYLLIHDDGCESIHRRKVIAKAIDWQQSKSESKRDVETTIAFKAP